MEEQKIVQRNIGLQRQWYGEPLGDRVRRLVVAFDVSQAYLAEVLGVSAPMLSQVMSGRRAKMANPAAFAKMIMLERKCLTPAVVSGDKQALVDALEDVRLSKPTVTRDNYPVFDDKSVLAAIREIADAEDLTDAADQLEQDFPTIADLLRRSANL